MTILIDASRALHPEPTGIEYYCREIILALLSLPEAQDHEWVLLSPKKPAANHPLGKLPQHARWQVIPGRRAWTWWHLSWFLYRQPRFRTAILFVPGHTLPLVTPITTVVVIHDLAYRYFTAAYGVLRSWWLNHELARSAKKATHIIVPSETTQRDLEKFYGIVPRKVSVIPHGIDHAKFRPLLKNEQPLLPKKLRLEQPYFFVLGRLEHRKNIIRILNAFHYFCVTQTTATTKLVFAGRPGYGWAAIQKRYRQLPSAIQKRIQFLGYLNDSEATLWLRAAHALLYPSLYEGFGLPALEAMAVGVPVITSRNSSISKITSQASLLINPIDEGELVKAMTQINTNQALRRQLITAGRQRAAQHTWEKAARETFKELYVAFQHQSAL